IPTARHTPTPPRPSSRRSARYAHRLTGNSRRRCCASPEPSTPKPKGSTTTRTTATPTPPQPLRAIAFRLLELGFTIAEHAGLNTHNIETAIARAYDLPGSSEPGTE